MEDLRKEKQYLLEQIPYMARFDFVTLIILMITSFSAILPILGIRLGNKSWPSLNKNLNQFFPQSIIELKYFIPNVKQLLNMHEERNQLGEIKLIH